MFTHWETIDGMVTPRGKLPHGHLSNIYYYTHFVYPQLYDDMTRNDVKKELDARFEGMPLPYKPYYDWEIALLKNRGWVTPNGKIIISAGRTAIYLGRIN